MASSSSSGQQKYQVFLSFRGEDTRNNFTSHLYAAFQRKGIDTFIDNQLIRGEQISQALLTAIEESTISVIVLSRNYALSSLCLDELSKILGCKKTKRQIVVPIFYHVYPSDVRNQRGSFEEAFANHQERFRQDKVQRWRAALVEVADLAGYYLPAQHNRLESTVVEEIAEHILKGLMYKSLYDTSIEGIKLLLCIDLVDVRIVGIWGMGGIGKTTTAKAVYDQFFAEFDGHCFVNVREELKYGQVHLREKLIDEILGYRNLNLGESLLPSFIKDELHDKKFLIVLDDVDDSIQLDFLPEKHCFGPGSRIIVISSDEQVLRNVADVRYKVEGLNHDKALQLFSCYAFKQNHPKQNFMVLSKKMVRYAKGVPLALKVLGSALYGRSKLDWQGVLNNLKEIPTLTIGNILRRISYDGLDCEVKDVFLDIACFFKGQSRDYVTRILDGCYSSATTIINILIDKSLISISQNMLDMHDLVQEMAFNIVRQESKGLGQCSRLWNPKDTYHVLKNNMGTGKVTGIFLDMSKSEEIHLRTEALEMMHNLRFLNFYYSGFKRERKVFLSEQRLESLPDTLTLLHWDDYPLKSLPSNFHPENLVELLMPNSHVKRLWNGVQNIAKLKRLDLTHSQHLIEIPDLSQATDLESMKLSGCTSLVELPSSIQCLNKLSLLDLNGTAIKEVPRSIGRLSRLKFLYMQHCRRLETLPSSICKLKCLYTFKLQGCLKLGSFPEILETMEGLEYLYLDKTSIEELPSSIENLVRLKCLWVNNLPSNVGELKSLAYLSLKNCSNITNFQEFPGKMLDLSETAIEQVPSSIACLSELQYLNLSGNNFETMPAGIFKQLLKLKKLDLSDCKGLQSLPELPPHLLDLEAYNCTSLQAVSESAFPINRDSGLRFIFTNCIKLDHKAIWAKTQLSIQQMATKDVKRYHKKKKKDPYLQSALSICFPGSEIPEWFSYQNMGSSVTIPFPHDNKFVGFALCVVVVREDFNEKLGCYVKYQGNFKTDGSDHGIFCDSSRSFLVNGSDHVFLGYNFNLYRGWYNGESKYHLNEASFKFYATDFECNPFMVKKCGVCLLYEDQDDLMAFPHRPDENESESGSESDVGECNPLVIHPNSPNDPTWLSSNCGVIGQDFVEPMVEDDSIINHESGSSNLLFAQPSSHYVPSWFSINQDDTKRPRDNYCYDGAEPSGNFSSDEEVETHVID